MEMMHPGMNVNGWQIQWSEFFLFLFIKGELIGGSTGKAFLENSGKLARAHMSLIFDSAA